MRVAAIDCGTNSIRLLIADIHDGGFKEVVRQMEVVRLGQGVDKNKAFDPEAIERTLNATGKYARLIATKGVEKIRFCATSATRDATNRDLFIDGVRNRLCILKVFEKLSISGQRSMKLGRDNRSKSCIFSD